MEELFLINFEFRNSNNRSSILDAFDTLGIPTNLVDGNGYSHNIKISISDLTSLETVLNLRIPIIKIHLLELQKRYSLKEVESVFDEYVDKFNFLMIMKKKLLQ